MKRILQKILLLTIVALLLNGCRYINTKNPHLEAKESNQLIIPEGLDAPNTSSELDVPKANDNNSLSTAKYTPPPEMPIRTKQSRKGDVRIENVGGYSELSAKTELEYMWQALESLEIENWATKNANQENCKLTLQYTDTDALERENASFIKKLFTRKNFYSDYSGEYTLSCRKDGSLVKTVFAKSDGSKPKSFLADSVMNALFDKFE